MADKYRVFMRSARNWNEFATAQKRTVRRGLTYPEAQQLCQTINRDLTPAQQKRGTKAEFECE